MSMSRHKRKKWLRRIAKTTAVLLLIIVVVGGLCWKTSTADAKQAVEDGGFDHVTLISKLPANIIPGGSCDLRDNAVFTFEAVDKVTHQKKIIEVCGNFMEIRKVTVK